MARIKTYEIDELISDQDIVIGSDFDNQDATKNYSVGALRNYINSGLEPVIGGTLKITTITDNQNVQPHIFMNNLEPALEVLQYEIVFLILGGRTWIFRENNGVYGVGEMQTVLSDFTEVNVSASIPIPTLDQVLGSGNSSIKDALVGRAGVMDILTSIYHLISHENREFKFANTVDNSYVSFGFASITFNDGVNSHRIDIPQGNFVAALQSKSGTIAYLDDIPNTYVGTLIAGSNAIVEELTPNNFRVGVILPTQDVFIEETEIYNKTQDFAEVIDGGDVRSIIDNTDPDEYNINLIFNENIIQSTEAVNLNYVLTIDYLYRNINDVFASRIECKLNEVFINGNVLIIPLPTAIFNSSLIQCELSINPKFLSNFKGCNSKHLVTWYLSEDLSPGTPA